MSPLDVACPVCRRAPGLLCIFFDQSLAGDHSHRDRITTAALAEHDRATEDAVAERIAAWLESDDGTGRRVTAKVADEIRAGRWRT